MPAFEEFLRDLLKALTDLAQSRWKEHATAALEDATAFLEKTKVDLERWTKMLSTGELSPEDFEWLVVSKRDLAEMEALKQAGLTLARLDRFRFSVIDTIIGVAFRSFL